MRLVERAIAAINARDIEGYRACCTEDVKLETPMAAVGGVYEGIEASGVALRTSRTPRPIYGSTLLDGHEALKAVGLAE